MRLFQCYPSGNCYKIRLLLNQLQLPYDSVEVDILKGESRTAKFLQLNSNGRVPVLEVDGKVLPESNAALFYLASGTPYLPTDRYAQAQVLRWMFFEQYSHEPYIATVRFWVALQQSAEQHAADIRKRMPQGYAALDVMDQHLRRHPFFVENQYSIADIALFAYTHVASEGGFDLSRFNHVLRWLERVKSQAGYISITD